MQCLFLLGYYHCVITRCLKITEKVSFYIASESSYVYILCGQKFVKKCQKWSNLASLRQTELPDRSVLIGQKLLENAKIKKFKCYILGDFQTTVLKQALMNICFMKQKKKPRKKWFLTKDGPKNLQIEMHCVRSFLCLKKRRISMGPKLGLISVSAFP